MKPIILEGNTLGQRHRHYNKLLKEALASNRGEKPEKISHEDNDIDNFLKIDIAIHNRDVNYILEVLKCKDLLYVTRAIKKSKWLITDADYTHIINPKFLHKELFPHMMQKAKSKLLLHIRLYLRDEKRVAHFYNYCKQFDVKHALKWLQYCPLQLALNEVYNHLDVLRISRFVRLCRRSFDFLDKAAASQKRPDWYKVYFIIEVQFLIRNKTEEYLNYADSLCDGYISFLKKKHLQFVMKTCPQKIFNNLLYYIQKVDHTKFIQYMDKEAIKNCLLKCSQQKDATQSIRSFDVLVKYLPKIEFCDRLDVLRALYGSASRIDLQVPGGLNLFFSAINDNTPVNSLCVFRWYQCMPFDIAYREITKLIQTESKRDVRVSMINTLLNCADGDSENILTVIKYYHDTHINELNNFKENFVNQILSRVAINKFDTEMWTLLNNLFYSMDVYKNSSSNSKYVETIIVHKIIHNQIVPEIIESKFKFKTLKSYKKKLNSEEREKLFIYLYERQMKDMENKTIASENEFKMLVKNLEITLQLLADWNKDVTDYPMILNKIRECVIIKKQNSWARDIDLSTFYNSRKQWRRTFFDYSLILNPSKQVLLNVLKHNRNMLNMYHKEVALIRYDDPVSLQPVLSKIKIYWADTLAKEWINEYFFHLNDTGKQKMAIQSLAVLLSQKQFLDIVEKYIPKVNTINWKEANEVEHGCRKTFSLYINRVRPLPDTDVVLRFAKGKYIKYAVKSLNATFSNLSHVDREEYISKLAKVPLTFQKHGIHMAFTIVETDKLIPSFKTIWTTAKNRRIRNSVFLTTHDLLCKQSKKSRILKLWELLDFFIENLSDREDLTIIQKLGGLYEIPEIVQSKYCMKAYRFLKSLPNKHEGYADNMIVDSDGIVVKKLDRDFVEGFILEAIENYSTKYCFVHGLFSKYLLFTQDKEFELDSYERLVKPMFYNTEYYPNFISMIFSYLPSNMCDDIVENKRVPVKLYKRLLEDFKQKLVLPEDYVDLKTFELMCDFVEILQHHISPKVYNCNDFDEILTIPLLTDFGKACSRHLQRNLKTFDHSIFAFEYILDKVFISFPFSKLHELQIYKYLLCDQGIVEIYLLVHRIMPKELYREDEKIIMDEIIAMLCRHPAKEIKMICQHRYPDKIQAKPETI
ncbi:hypothetical protein ABMA28_010241 [Loxostege sticticalis]|uniref:Uncharacterized protein n=1 Tax=Loxostege sticticalis TaxID=481309 RepID=A0ABD0SAQ6_LOXSC